MYIITTACNLIDWRRYRKIRLNAIIRKNIISSRLIKRTLNLKVFIILQLNGTFFVLSSLFATPKLNPHLDDASNIILRTI